VRPSGRYSVVVSQEFRDSLHNRDPRCRRQAESPPRSPRPSTAGQARSAPTAGQKLTSAVTAPPAVVNAVAPITARRPRPSTGGSATLRQALADLLQASNDDRAQSIRRATPARTLKAHKLAGHGGHRARTQPAARRRHARRSAVVAFGTRRASRSCATGRSPQRSHPDEQPWPAPANGHAAMHRGPATCRRARGPDRLHVDRVEGHEARPWTQRRDRGRELVHGFVSADLPHQRIDTPPRRLSDQTQVYEPGLGILDVEWRHRGQASLVANHNDTQLAAKSTLSLSRTPPRERPIRPTEWPTLLLREAIPRVDERIKLVQLPGHVDGSQRRDLTATPGRRGVTRQAGTGR
jgi:hypothetical protein